LWNNPQGEESVFEQILSRFKGPRPSSHARTLTTVATISFFMTGALLLAWDWVEHEYLGGVSAEVAHRLHMIRGVTTGMLVSVGIAAVLLRNRRRYEKRMLTLQRELIRKERLAAVGELAGGVAHEIRNPLAGIGGALNVLSRELPADDENQELMEEMQRQVRRMEHLVADLLAYARPGKMDPEWTQIHMILKQAAGTVQQLSAIPDADLVLDLDPQVRDVFADARELEHAFENLILNAFQAVSTGGKVQVRTRQLRDRVRVSIQDDGCGMEQDVQERIFEPFFTTKARGTGLGLSLVRRAVENQEGTISLHSTPSLGTTFEVVLPTGEIHSDGREGVAGFGI
jgi:signal transduction histidine kinase